jgi:CubicO group peptidase (beta-lactamase class C family)
MSATMQALDQEAVDALVARAHREVDEGLLPSCQLSVAYRGEVVVEVALGDATVDSRYVIFSATKALIASAIWLLIGDGLLDPSVRVAEIVPEFATNGKDVVTVEHVMLHTGGFPRAPLGPPEWYTRDGRLAAFERWRLSFTPGSQFEYHPTSGHWVLAEIIERLSGGDYRDFVRSRILEPIGLTRLVLGCPIEEQGDVVALSGVGEAATPDELEAAIGVREIPVGDVTEDALLALGNTPENLALGVPGGGAVSTASDLARFYQALLHDPSGIWDPAVRLDGISNVRNRYPDLLGTPANRSLGLVIAGDDGNSAMRGMGYAVSPGAFGHNGAGGQIAWADPATGLSFVYLTNGLDRNVLREARRTSGIASRAARCVGNPAG